ncbi:hypothetical protein N0V93_007491 [Gnomoniopsis smithogilvyi]|uniref:Ras-like GTP-binding protein n=1 Tax=Gnomoniopsis smithogilvyi TaxID=1191159 RepID=A0A9W9CVE8_9PEZI|nr:hypothetical protein N0V93_007491 [Gnomoniopsis smithogilvyi]
MSSALEAKIVVLGSQGVGKTSLVMRYCKGAFDPSQITSTVGASFMTKRVVDSDTDTQVRLQIWDTAGQERFRSISRLYYRGANACILCYSITDAQSFADMGAWLTELRRNLPADIVLHIVGTKSDVVAREPQKREVPFERCIAYVAENLAPGTGATPPPTAGATSGGAAAYLNAPGLATTGGSGFGGGGGGGGGGNNGGFFSTSESPSVEPRSPTSKRSSGFWGQEAGWDACHEISAESGEGVEEVFRVVTRKLVEQNRKMQAAILAATSTPGLTPGYDGTVSSASGMGYDGAGQGGYFDGARPGGSFRVGRDRRSWLFSPGFSPSVTVERAQGGQGAQQHEEEDGVRRKNKCC